MRGVNLRVAALLLAPAARAMPWTAFLAATGLALAIVAVPAAATVALSDRDLVGLLRAAAICGGLGVAFLLDDPAARTIATVPTPRPIRYAARAGVILPAVALWWTLVLTITVLGAEQGIGATLPLGAVTVEAAALGALALAVALARLRGRPEGGGLVASCVLLMLVVVASLLPEDAALFVAPGQSPAETALWEGAHERWALLLAAAVAGGLWASPEPLRRRLRRPT